MIPAGKSVQARSSNRAPQGDRVRTQAQHDAVVAAAWQGHAVTFVVDELQVTG